MPPIPEAARRTEAEFWAAFDAQAPRLFAAILRAVALGLRELPDVRLDTLPRMADFSRWGEGVCRALGWPPGTFLKAYQGNRQAAVESVLEDAPVAAAVRSWVATCPDQTWEGNAAGLLDELNRQDPARTANPRWPKSPRGLSGHLRRLAPALRAVGLDVKFGAGRDRRLRLAPPKVGKEPSQPSQPSQTRENKADPWDGRATVATVGVTVESGDRHAPDSLPAAARDGCDGCDGQTPTLAGDVREVF
jgi:hypothetical protein